MIRVFFQENCSFVIHRFLKSHLNIFFLKKENWINYLDAMCFLASYLWFSRAFSRSIAFYYKVTSRSDEEKGGEVSIYPSHLSLPIS